MLLNGIQTHLLDYSQMSLLQSLHSAWKLCANAGTRVQQSQKLNYFFQN